MNRSRFLIIVTVFVFCSFSLWNNRTSVALPHIQRVEAKANPPSNLKKTPGKIYDDKTIRQEIKQYLLRQNVNGTVLVVKNDKVIMNEGFGYANLLTKLPNTAYTTYGIGSITKCFVSTSIMQLQEQGKLNINDPLAKYFPAFPHGKEIRLYHLLTHTSGLHSVIIMNGKGPHQATLFIKRQPLSFVPGTKWDYRDANYIILGYVVQKVSGMPLHDYISKHIFVPVGMKHSGFLGNNGHQRLSASYEKAPKGLVEDKSLYTRYLFGCGDIYTTAYDLYLFDHALFNGRLVGRNSLNQMLTPNKNTYGLGLYVQNPMIYSRGVVNGWECLHSYYKDNHSYIEILLNIKGQSTPTKQISQDIHQLII